MNAVMIRMRSLARRWGFISWLVHLTRKLGIVRGEQNFEKLMERSITAGDVVWDVGANVGLYTKKFSQWVGVSGKVYAFEPAPSSFGALQTLSSQMTNVTCLNVALGATSGIAHLEVDSGNQANPTNKIQRAGSAALAQFHVVEVEIQTGDELARRYGFPSIVKIDVEGFETEVLKGMKAILEEPKCRALFIEVHFGLLEQAGKKFAPVEMVKELKEAGFRRVSWADHSHIAAFRI